MTTVTFPQTYEAPHFKRGDLIYIAPGMRLHRVVRATATTLDARLLRWYERLWFWIYERIARRKQTP